MRETVVRQLLAEYSQRHNQALMEASERRTALLRNLPGYFDLERELTGALRDLSLYRSEHPTLTADQIREKGKEMVADIRKRQELLLTQAGVTQEELAPHFQCPICEDTGYVGEPVHRFCTCFTQELTRRLYEDARLSGQTFADFDLTLFSEEGGTESPRRVMQRARLFSEDFVQSYPHVPQHSLLLLGPTGAGKTFLMNCIGAALLDRGFTVMRISAFRLSQILRDIHRGIDEENLDSFLSVDLLCIDDLGTEPLYENITLPYLQNILDERLQTRKGTLLTTNLTLQEIKTRYSERVFSRLTSQDTRILRFSGRDIRNTRSTLK